MCCWNLLTVLKRRVTLPSKSLWISLLLSCSFSHPTWTDQCSLHVNQWGNIESSFPKYIYLFFCNEEYNVRLHEEFSSAFGFINGWCKNGKAPNYFAAARVAARSTGVSFYHAIWLAKEKTKVFTSQKSFSGSGSQTLGAIPLTKISGNSGTKSNGTERFWKFVSKIVDNLRRLSLFLEIWKFRKFPVPFGISTRFESTPVPLVVKSYKMAASKSVRSTLHWMQNDLPRLEPVLDRKRKR